MSRADFKSAPSDWAVVGVVTVVMLLESDAIPIVSERNDAVGTLGNIRCVFNGPICGYKEHRCTVHFMEATDRKADGRVAHEVSSVPFGTA